MKKQSRLFLPLLSAGFALFLLGFFWGRSGNRPLILTDRAGHTDSVWRSDAGAESHAELPAEAVTEPVFPIDINTADIGTLTYLPGIGPELAKRIVGYRQENGPFQQLSELTNVSGIGQTRLDQIYPYITLGG